MQGSFERMWDSYERKQYSVVRGCRAALKQRTGCSEKECRALLRIKSPAFSQKSPSLKRALPSLKRALLSKEP